MPGVTTRNRLVKRASFGWTWQTAETKLRASKRYDNKQDFSSGAVMRTHSYIGRPGRGEHGEPRPLPMSSSTREEGSLTTRSSALAKP